MEDLESNDTGDEFSQRINRYSKQIIKDNKITFIIAIFFALITFLQPIILVFTINQSDNYSTAMINSINLEFKNQTKGIQELILKEEKNLDNSELTKLENNILKLSKIKEKNIENVLNKINRNNFDSVKIIIRNILLGIIWTLCLFKIYKI